MKNKGLCTHYPRAFPHRRIIGWAIIIAALAAMIILPRVL